MGDQAKDKQLVRSILGGDEAAFTELVERYHSHFIHLALVYVADRATAEEVAQETWLAVINGLSSFEGRSPLKTWLFRILTNRAKTRAVREGRSVPFSSLAEEGSDAEPVVDPARFGSDGMWVDPPQPWERDTPERLVQRQESMRLLEAAIAQLPPNQRAVITLRDVEGLESEEVCNVLEISETNQRVLLHRARSRVRRALEEHLGRK